MKYQNHPSELYVKSQSKPSKFSKYFIYGTFFLSIPALLIAGTATKDERIDTAKEQILSGQKINYTEVETQQKKIRQAKYAIAYYCEDNPSDDKCPNLTQNDDRRHNPLGGLKEVSYEPKKGQSGAFSWKADIAPPISGLGQQVKIVQAPKIKPKIKPKHDKIDAVIAENNIRNAIKGY